MTNTPFGSILDVPGVGVGHHQRTGVGWQTGTTVVTVAAGATPGVDVRGGGPGTRETDALATGEPRPARSTPSPSPVGARSASRLPTASSRCSSSAASGFRSPMHVVPVVPAAVIFDLGRGGDLRPSTGCVVRRAGGSGCARWSAHARLGVGRRRHRGACRWTAGRCRHGQHDRSDRRRRRSTVGAIAVVNANGSAIDPTTALPWERHGLGLTRPSAAERRSVRDALTASGRRGAEHDDRRGGDLGGARQGGMLEDRIGRPRRARPSRSACTLDDRR